MQLDRFVINAHRGDINPTDGFPENTLEAFRSAAFKGARMSKGDCQLSADGTWYMMHDITVDRTTNGSGHISAMTDAQVEGLNIDGGFGYRAAHAGLYHPPKLIDVLTAVAQYGVIMELQCKDGASWVSLATFLLGQGYSDAVILAVGTEADAAAVKAVGDFMVMSATNWVEVDVVEAEITSLPVVSDVAPKPFSTYIDASNYGVADDAALTRTAWMAGVRIYAPLDLNAALAEYRKIISTDAVEEEATGLNTRVTALELGGGGGGGSVTFSGASVTRSSTQSVPNNTSVAIGFNVEEYDTSSYHDNVTNNTRLTAPVAGKYRVTANIEYPPSGSGFRDTNIRLNGTTNICRLKTNPASSGSTAHSLSRDVALSAGDYVEVTVSQTSGGTFTMGVNGNSPFFQIHLLPGS